MIANHENYEHFLSEAKFQTQRKELERSILFLQQYQNGLNDICVEMRSAIANLIYEAKKNFYIVEYRERECLLYDLYDVKAVLEQPTASNIECLNNKAKLAIGNASPGKVSVGIAALIIGLCALVFSICVGLPMIAAAPVLNVLALMGILGCIIGSVSLIATGFKILGHYNFFSNGVSKAMKTIAIESCHVLPKKTQNTFYPLFSNP